MQAIETHYKGYRFRSRLEARWAVFFETLGVAWEYEKQGFELRSGRYLPDFYLPSVDDGCWLEIKPMRPSDGEGSLAEQLCSFTKQAVYVFFGDVPGFDVFNEYQLPTDGAYVFRYQIPEEDGEADTAWDNCQAFCACDACGLVGIEYCGRSERLPCKECWHCYEARRSGGAKPCGNCSGACRMNAHRDYTLNHERILRAVTAARSARFEHGESPR